MPFVLLLGIASEQPSEYYCLWKVDRNQYGRRHRKPSSGKLLRHVKSHKITKCIWTKLTSRSVLTIFWNCALLQVCSELATQKSALEIASTMWTELKDSSDEGVLQSASQQTKGYLILKHIQHTIDSCNKEKWQKLVHPICYLWLILDFESTQKWKLSLKPWYNRVKWNMCSN